MARKKEKILIVDDEVSVLTLVKGILKGKGYTVKTAGSGKIALKLIGTFKPNLLLLDMVMSGMSGVDVCQKIRADPKTKDLRVVFLTVVRFSLAGVDVLKEFGVMDYITKPFSTKDLLKRVKKALVSETPHPKE